MNILFFLIPKSQVAYVNEHDTFRQVAEKLDFHHYTAIPVLSDEGKYKGTVAVGDLFWFVKRERNMNYKSAENYKISDVPFQTRVESIRFDANMDDLLHLAMNQNFVPVTDDHDIFIGIITRKAIIEYFVNNKKE
jgi:CBS-domain-containing membrane protein